MAGDYARHYLKLYQGRKLFRLRQHCGKPAKNDKSSSDCIVLVIYYHDRVMVKDASRPLGAQEQECRHPSPTPSAAFSPRKITSQPRVKGGATRAWRLDWL